MSNIAQCTVTTNVNSEKTVSISRINNTVEISIVEQATDCPAQLSKASIILPKGQFLALLQAMRLSDEVFRL